MKTKSVTFLIDSLRGGGAETVCVNLANSLSDRGWAVTLVVLNLNDSVQHNSLVKNVELVVLGKNHARTSLVCLGQFLQEQKPNRILVFNHQLAVLLVLLRMMLRANFKIVARNINTLSKKKSVETSLWHKYIVHMLTKTLYRKVDCVIAQSTGMANDLMSNYGIPVNKLVIIHNPVRSEIQRFRLAERTAKKEYIVCVGRLEPQKAFHYAISAFAMIAPNNPYLRLKIIGTGSLEGALRGHAHAVGVGNRVDFEGYTSDIIPYYVGAKATLLTSLYEGFPNVLVESIALGTPVVAFDCPSGVNEIVQDGVNGRLVPYKNEVKLVEGLRHVLKTDWCCATVSKTADSFRSDRIVPEYERVIE